MTTQGFASSSPFKGVDDSELENLKLANRRAKVVRDMLNDEVATIARKNKRPLDLALVDIKPYDWPAYNDMGASTRYIDNEGTYQTSRGRWNRRVNVVLERPGTCEVPAQMQAAGAQKAELPPRT